MDHIARNAGRASSLVATMNRVLLGGPPRCNPSAATITAACPACSGVCVDYHYGNGPFTCPDCCISWRWADPGWVVTG